MARRGVSNVGNAAYKLQLIGDAVVRFPVNVWDRPIVGACVGKSRYNRQVHAVPQLTAMQHLASEFLLCGMEDQEGAAKPMDFGQLQFARHTTVWRQYPVSPIKWPQDTYVLSHKRRSLMGMYSTSTAMAALLDWTPVVSIDRAFIFAMALELLRWGDYRLHNALDRWACATPLQDHSDKESDGDVDADEESGGELDADEEIEGDVDAESEGDVADAHQGRTTDATAKARARKGKIVQATYMKALSEGQHITDPMRREAEDMDFRVYIGALPSWPLPRMHNVRNDHHVSQVHGQKHN